MTNLRDTQLEMVKMVAEVDKLFKENGIKYTLLGGSVLGAIRHKGFIPWDDDMDIAVWRKDFEKAENLLSNLKNYTYEFAQKHIIPDAPTGHLRLINEKYPIELSPNIDFFALDKVPSDKKERKKVQFMANIFHATVYRKPPKNRGKFNKFIFTIFFGIAPNFVLDILQNLSYKYMLNLQNKNYENLGNIFGAYSLKEDFKAEIYENLTLAEFENLKLPIPKDYDFYLTQMYGDYMKLPPIEQQKPKHKKIDFKDNEND